MVEIWWEFRANPDRVAEFERDYGESGGWAALYGRSAEFRGTSVVRNVSDPLHYLLVDRWTSLRAFEAFKATNEAEWHALDVRCQGLTTMEKPLGTFEALPATD